MKQPYLIALILFAPFLSIVGQDETLHPWTDTQGRTLTASFISSDGKTVTIKWNGKVFPLPISSLAPQSQELARKLSAPSKPKPPSAPVSPFDEILNSVPQDVLGPEALDIEHEWSSSDGRPIKAKFIGLNGDQLSLSMNAGAKQFTLGLNHFSTESQALAKLLQSLAAKHRPVVATKPIIAITPPATTPVVPTAPSAPAVVAKPSVPSKPLPLPKVTEDDLEKVHSWTNSSGNPLEASFVAATDKDITLKIARRSSPYVLTWDKLSPESQALGKALQKLKKSLVPSILPAKVNVLSRYSSGKWKDYNTILESVAFEAGIYAHAKYDSKLQRHLMFPLDVWFVKDGQRLDETKMTLTVQPFAYSARFDENGKPIMRDGKQEWRYHRRWIKSVSSPEVSTDRRKTSIEGILDNGSEFDFNYELSQTGVSIWGEVKDSRKEDYPTHFRIFVYSTSLASTTEASQMTAAQINETAGDGTFYIDLVKGKKVKFPFSEQFVSIKQRLRKESKGEDISIAKVIEYKGSPFGDHRAKIQHKAKNTQMRWDEGYGAKFALQGIRMEVDTFDSIEAKNDRENQKKYKGLSEIGYGDRIEVKVYRGD